MKDNDISRFRTEVLRSANYDIMGLCETFLRGDEKLDIPGFSWIGHNRTVTDPRAQRGSGGVGFLIHQQVRDEYRIEILDKEYEEILWIKLTNPEGHCVVLCVV